MDFNTGDIVSLPTIPFKPFKIWSINRNKLTLMLTPVGRFEEESFRTFTFLEFENLGYQLYDSEWI